MLDGQSDGMTTRPSGSVRSALITLKGLGWWGALVVLLPLAYNPFSRWQYEPDKAALALALTGLLLGRALARGELPRPRLTPLTGTLAGSLLLRWWTLARSPAPHWGLWGDPAWRNGLWLALACALLFLLARSQLGTHAERRTLCEALLGGSALIAGYGLLQYAGLDPLHAQPWVRVPSTLAHPNLLAAYLALVMPVTAAFATEPDTRRHHRLAAVLLLLAQGACLVFTYSRAGWLAALTGLGLFALAQLWLLGRRRWAGGLAFTALLVLLLLLGLSLRPPLPGSAPHALQTLTSLFRWQGATVQIRLLGWRAGLEALAERPWLGYGPATFHLILPRFLPPQLAPFGGAGALGGRPHNVYLEVALESGLIGLGLFVGLLGLLLVPPVTALRQRRVPSGAEGPLLAALVGSLVANLVTYVFSFESVTSAVLFWTLAGMAHAIAAPLPPPRPTTHRRPCLGALIAVGTLTLGGWMVAPDVAASAGERLLRKGATAAGLDLLAWAGRVGPTPEPFWAIAGAGCAHAAALGEPPILWERGDHLLDQWVAAHPTNPEAWQRRGDYLRRWYRAAPRPERGTRALDAYSRALDLSPRDPDLWLDRGLLWLDLGQPSQAHADFERAGSLLPNYTRYYGALSLHAQAQGDLTAADRWQKQALEAQRAWNAWSWRR